MEKVPSDSLVSEPWTKQELELLKSLVKLKIPMDIISNELERSWTATYLEALELDLDFCEYLAAGARE
jgi:hypothetical protein